MKELSVQEKARRYDEIIEKFGTILNLNTVKESGTIFTDDVRKILTELAESEDERIKKCISLCLEECMYKDIIRDYERDECLAWLEKQGEQKLADKVEPKFKVGNKIKLAIEPKYPAREIIAIQNDAYYFDERVYLPFSRQDEWELVEQNPAGWSEEDKEIIDYLIDYLESELDSSYTDLDKETFNKEINWLKSLRPQNRWKPSDEQMIAIQEAMDIVGILTITGCRINSLYQDLKKLKEVKL